MRWSILTALVGIGTMACGTEKADSLAEIGWQLDYRDFTDPATAPDLRGCDNQPAVQVGPAYRPIAKVRILIKDPEGQVAGVDREYDCAQGVNGERLPVRGIVIQEYELTVEAKAADGTVLYRYENPSYDLTASPSETYTLQAATGELGFFPRYDQSLTCPATVAKMRYTLFKNSPTGPESTPTVSGVSEPACEQGFNGLESKSLVIREIPVSIEPGSFQTYNDYKLRLEALNAGDGVVSCVTNPFRSVRPGNHSIAGDESLSPGSSCP